MKFEEFAKSGNIEVKGQEHGTEAGRRKFSEGDDFDVVCVDVAGGCFEALERLRVTNPLCVNLSSISVQCPVGFGELEKDIGISRAGEAGDALARQQQRMGIWGVVRQSHAPMPLPRTLWCYLVLSSRRPCLLHCIEHATKCQWTKNQDR